MTRLLSQTGDFSAKLDKIDSGKINHEERTVDLSFSSEHPVERWFGNEILDHSATAVRMQRLNDGAPLLINHDRNRQIGVVLEARIDTVTKRGTARVKFSRSALGEEAFRDVQDNIRRNVSTGYRYHNLILEEEKKDGPSTYRVTDWEPMEISLAAIAADPNIGVGRSLPEGLEPPTAAPAPARAETASSRIEVPPPPVQQSSENQEGLMSVNVEQERSRILEIVAMGEKFGKRELADKAAREGRSVDQFSGDLLRGLNGAPDVPVPIVHVESGGRIGLSAKEARSFSFVRAIRAMVDNNWSQAGFEMEVSEATKKSFSRSTSGFLVPTDVLTAATRDGATAAVPALMTSNTPTVETEIPATFIELLRAKLIVRQLGARVLAGLQGNLAIPRLRRGATAYWVAENDDVPQQKVDTEQVPLSPKSVGNYTDLSRRLLIQSSPDVEAMVRDDIAYSMALAIDRAAICGSGIGNEPKGIMYAAGVGTADLPGGRLSYPSVVALETMIANYNADQGNLAYVTTPLVRGLLKTTEIVPNSPVGRFIWQYFPNGMGMVNGYPAFATNVIPTGGDSDGASSTMVFGNWSDVVIGEWGILDVQLNPYINSKSGAIRVRALQDVDVALRHPESFAYYSKIRTGPGIAPPPSLPGTNPSSSVPTPTPTPTPVPAGGH